VTPHRDRGKGSFLIDRRLPGVGRFKMASGTSNRAELRAFNDLLSGLAEAGRVDLLRALNAGTYDLRTVLRHWREQSLAELPTGEGLAPLAPALALFLKGREVARKTRQDMTTAFAHLERAAGTTGTVSGLSVALRALKETMREARTPHAFNKARAYALAFARHTHGKHSPLWNAVSGVDPFTEKERARLMARNEMRRQALVRRSLSVVEFDMACKAFVDVPIHGGKRGGGKTLRRTVRAAELREMAWTLVTSGMRPQEFWRRDRADWRVVTLGNVIRVEGTKTRAAARFTLALPPVVGPVVGEALFRRAFAAATERALGVSLDVYSLRRTFAAWGEDVRLIETRRKAYLGHGKRDVTDVYLQRDVLPYVSRDGAQLRAWIEEQRAEARPKLVPASTVSSTTHP
jgi:hypothetical protein